MIHIFVPTIVLSLLTQLVWVYSTSVQISGRCVDLCTHDVLNLYPKCAIQYLSHACQVIPCIDNNKSNQSNDKQMSTYACGFFVKNNIQVYLNDTTIWHNVSHTEGIKLEILMKEELKQMLTNDLPIDMYLLLDATFTTTKLLDDFKRNVFKLIHHLENLSSDVHAGIGIFRDESELTNGFTNLLSLSTRLQQVATKVGTITNEGGLDFYEAHLPALYITATNETIGFRSFDNNGKVKVKKMDEKMNMNGLKMILMMSSFVGHEPSCTGNLPILDRRIVSEVLMKRKIIPIFYSAPGFGMDAQPVPYGCSSSNKNTSAKRGQGSYITKKTAGVYIRGEENQFDVTDVNEAISKKVEDYVNSVNSVMMKVVSVDGKDCERWFVVSGKFDKTKKNLQVSKNDTVSLILTPKTNIVCSVKSKVIFPIRCRLKFFVNSQQIPYIMSLSVTSIDCKSSKS